ncbi:hypothetical protein D3C71_1909390 [compost metagenome]
MAGLPRYADTFAAAMMMEVIAYDFPPRSARIFSIGLAAAKAMLDWLPTIASAAASRSRYARANSVFPSRVAARSFFKSYPINTTPPTAANAPPTSFSCP